MRILNGSGTTNSAKQVGFTTTTKTIKKCRVRRLFKSLLTMGMVLAAGIFTTGMNQVAQAAPAQIDSKAFSAFTVSGHRTIRIISSDGERFDTIEDGSMLRVKVSGHVDPKGRDRVITGGFLLGACKSAPNCSQNFMRFIEQSGSYTKRWNFDKTLFIPTDLITHSSSSGISSYPDGDNLIRGCNSRMGADGPVNTINYISNINISASAETKDVKGQDFVTVSDWNETYFGGDVGMAKSILVDVECVPNEELLKKPVSISTRVEDPAGFNQQESCPRTIKHFTSIYYHQPTNVRFNIKLNGEVVKSVEESTDTVPISDGTTLHVLHHETEIESPGGPNGYQVKIVGGGESTVQYYHVHCPEFRVTSSHLQYNFVENGECPRTVWETATFRTNGPGTVNYKIKHSGGLTFKTGEVQSKLFGDKYKAVAQRTFAPTDSVDWDMTAIPEGFEDAQSGWTKLKLLCTKDVEGELTLDTSPQDDALDPVTASWDGELTIADSNVRQGEYPRPAQLFFEVEREAPGNFDYHISCSNGRSFQGSSASAGSGGSKWKAFGTHNFNMTRPMLLQCRLREVKPNGAKVSIDVAKLLFKGAPVNPDLAGDADTLVSPDQDDDRDLPTNKPLTGGFSFIDNSNAAKQNKCERTAKALVWFDTPKNDNIHYSLDCGALGNFSGVLQPNEISTGKYRAGKLINFQIDKTIEAGCTLRTVSPGAPKDHSFKAKTFQCVGSAGHSSGIDDVQAPTNPQTDSNDSAILPKVCKGGKIRYGVCTCPQGTKLKKIGDSKFECKIDGIASPTKPSTKTAPLPPKEDNAAKRAKEREAAAKRVAAKKAAAKKAAAKKAAAKKAAAKKAAAKKAAAKKAAAKKAAAKKAAAKKAAAKKAAAKKAAAKKAAAKKAAAKKAAAKKAAAKKAAAKRANAKKKALICKGGKVRGNRCNCPKGMRLKKQGKRKFLCFRPAG